MPILIQWVLLMALLATVTAAQAQSVGAGSTSPVLTQAAAEKEKGSNHSIGFPPCPPCL